MKRGEFTYGDPTVIKYEAIGAEWEVGKYCSIGDGVTILLGGEHNTDTISTYPFLERGFNEATRSKNTKGNVIIGNDVWIGHGVTILSGVTIGDGAVVGACSLVSKDVPPYAMVAGNPARLIRYRFPEHIRAKLLEIAWWNWDSIKVRENIKLITGTDAQEFIDKNTVAGG